MRYTAAGTRSKELFAIDDDAGTQQFEVRKIYGDDGNSLSLRSPAGEELARIAERHGPTRCEITADGESGTVRHLGWFGRRYAIQTPAGEMTASVGDFSAESYELTGFGTVKAVVSRQFIRQQNLIIDITDGEEPISLIAAVLAIETLRDDRRQNQESIPYVRLLLRLVN
jgi:uncharacterized protein YxjI